MALYSVPSHWEVSEAAPTGSNRLLVCGNGRYFQIGGLAARIVSALDGTSRTPAELEREMEKECGPSSFTMEQIRECIAKLLSYGILSDGNDAAVGEREKKSKWFGHRYFAAKVSLLQPKLIYPITKRMAVLYSPFWIAILCPTLLVIHLAIWLYLYLHAGRALHFGWPRGVSLVMIIAGNYLGLLLHELGHAAACVRCNIKHGAIGVGIYLVLPAFYTDVSEAWKLSKTQRMAVDAAGMYTSLILSSVSFVLFATTGNYVFLVLTMLYDLSVLMNLNPFIRMDCYWLLSDALGVCNLMTLSKEMTVWIVQRMCRLRAQQPALLRSSSPLRAILFCYYAGSLIFGALVIGRLVWIYVPHYLMDMPNRLAGLKLAFELHGLSTETAAWAFRIGLNSVPLLGIVLYGTRGATKLFQLLNEKGR